MKKIAVNYYIFRVSAWLLGVLAWIALWIYMDAPVMTFLFVLALSYVLIRLSVRYLFELT
jgi:hypothetical protein